MKYYIRHVSNGHITEVENFQEVRQFFQHCWNNLKNRPEEFYSYAWPWYRYHYDTSWRNEDWFIHQSKTYIVYDHHWNVLDPLCHTPKVELPNTFHARKERRMHCWRYWHVDAPFIYRYDPVPGVHKYPHGGCDRLHGLFKEYRKGFDEEHAPFVKPERRQFFKSVWCCWEDLGGRSRYANGVSWKNTKKRKQWM